MSEPVMSDAFLDSLAYWPALAPDATRQFQPNKWMDGQSYPWPSIAPQTDEEIGMVPANNGKLMSWDGVPGPARRVVDGREVVAYHDIEHVDYIDLLGTMTAVLTARIEADEYKARILAMAAVYWSLGIQEGDPIAPDNYRKLMRQKSDWAVFSFRSAAPGDADFQSATSAVDHKFAGQFVYRFEIFRWGDHREDATDPRITLVDILEEVTAYSDGRSVIKKAGDKWTLDVSIPT